MSIHVLAPFFFPLSRTVCFLSLQTDRTLSRIPEMSEEKEKEEEEEKEDILETITTEFYDPNFEITENSTYFSTSSLSSVTIFFSMKEWETEKAEFTK